MRRRTPVLRAAALALTSSLALAACGGGDSEEDAKGPDAQAVAAGAELASTWPLTGLPVSGDQEAAQEHPVMVLKMDNTYASAPQEGLGSADMVVEELVEGGMTRLAVFYYSKIPGEVGPVRSMRASDIGIVTPVDASVVTSGAASVTIERIREAGIRYFNEGARGFYRESSRYAPYNLFTNLRKTSSLTTAPPARPADYLQWGDGSDLPQGQPATSLVADFGASHSTEWTYREGRYVNDNSFAATDDRFEPDNVLVLRVRIGDAGYTDPAGYPVPETELSGSGPAEIFRQGRRVKVRWTKTAPEAQIQLTKRGQPVAMPAGRTWIELVPEDTGDVTFQP